MKKLAFLTCDDLTSFVVDDELLFTALKSSHPTIEFDVLSWSDKKVDWSKYQFAVIRTTWDYTKRLPEFLEKLESIQIQGCAVLNSPEIVKWNASKDYLSDLQRAGVSIIDSYYLKEWSIDDLSKVLSDSKTYVLKPIVGASADQIEVLSKESLIKRIKSLKVPSQWFVQPFVKEVLHGERSLFFLNSVFSHAVKKVPKDGDFRVQEEHGGIITSYEPSTSDLDFADTVLQAIGQNLLYSRIDFLVTDTGPKLIELELIEPSFYFRTNKKSATNFVNAIKNLL